MRWTFTLAAGFAFAVSGAGLRAAEATAREPETSLLADLGSRRPEPRVAPASDEGNSALRQMKPSPGAFVSLWAAEPMLANPTALAFDESGRLFVAESHRARTSALDMRDYPGLIEPDLACRSIEDRAALIAEKFGAAGVSELSQETEIVRRLEDADDDGVADTTAVYATGFNAPLDGTGAGVLAREDEVWFTDIPSLWRLTGRKKADTRRELSRGYGVRFGVGGHDLRSPIFGPDGKIYFTCGDRGAHVATPEGGGLDVPDSGAVFRCRPDGTGLELYAWGLCNPQGLCFNERGDLFAADGDAGLGDEERLVQIVEHGDSGWRVGFQHAPRGDANPWLAERRWRPRHAGQPAFLIPPVSNIEDGPVGAVYHPGMGLAPADWNSIFIAHQGETLAESGIYAYKLKSDGAGYAVAEATPFLLGATPTALQFGPDCQLYFATRGEGESRLARGRIYAIGRSRRLTNPFEAETRRLIGEDFATEVPEELAHLLGHPDWRLRLKAERALVEHGSDGFATLTQVLANQDAPPLARLHATWGIGQLAAANPAAPAVLPALLLDPDPDVRAQAAKLLGDGRVVEALPRLVAALQDANPRVRFFAAQSLGHLGRPEATGPLLALLRENRDQDVLVRHAAVMGLAGCSPVEVLAAAAKSADRAERLGALLALRRLGRPEVAAFLADADPLIGREAACAINDEPIAPALPALAGRLAQAGDDEAVVVRALNAHFRLGQPANAEALAAYAGRADAPAALRIEALAQLAAWPSPPARDRIVGVFRPLVPATRDPAVARSALLAAWPALLAAGAGPEVQLAALAAVESLDLRAAADRLAAAVVDPQQADAVRAGALETLARWQDARLKALVAVAVDAATPRLRLVALPLAARLMPDRAEALVDRLLAASDVSEQKGAFEFLGTQPSARAGTRLAALLEQLAAGRVAPAVQLELVQAAERRSEPAVRRLLAEREAALAATGDPVAPYRVTVAGGDAARGGQLFYRQPVRACVRCHDAGQGGGAIGPNLAGVGRRRSRDDLLEAIVRPNLQVMHGYESAIVTQRTGDVVVGKIARETTGTLSLRGTDGRLVRIKKADIVTREEGTSAMPSIYPWTLNPGQVRDLVEFLAGLNTAPAAHPAAAQLRALRPAPE